MNIIIQSTKPSIQNNLISSTRTISEKYQKIMAVALVAIMGMMSLYFIFRRYQAKRIDPSESSIPAHVRPHPAPEQNSTNKGPITTPPSAPIQPINPNPIQPPIQPPITTKPVVDQPKPPVVDQPKPIQPPITTNKPIVAQSNPIKTPDSSQKTPQSTDMESLFTTVGDICGKTSENILKDPKYSVVEAIGKIDKKLTGQTKELLDEIISIFEKKNSYLTPIGYGQAVPSYFSQVGAQNENERKYFSLIGIRNLLLHGPKILDELRDTKFLGGEHHYSAYPSLTGLRSFKFYTGNMVDLDTSLNAKDDEEAKTEARKLIVEFGKKCGMSDINLTAEVVAQRLPNRKLNISNYTVHDCGASNEDRSNHGVWKRSSPVNAKIEYYANVPDPDTVIGATVRLPYLLAELFYHAKNYKGGALREEFLNELFDKGISTMCYNYKLSTLLDFYMTWTAKFTDQLTPEEEAKKNLESGRFGQVLRAQDPNEVLKSAFTTKTLSTLLDNYYLDADDNPISFDKNLPQKEYIRESIPFDKNLPQKEWIAQQKWHIQKILEEQELWEKRLFRKDEKDTYFLLNETTLNIFLPQYHDYLVSMIF